MEDPLQSSDEELTLSKYFPPVKRPRLQDDTRVTASSTKDTSSCSLPQLIYEDSQSRTRASLIHQIEAIFTSLATSLASSTSSPLQLSLNPRRRTSTTFDTTTSTIRRPATASKATISFPDNAWRFACILKVLDTIHESLVEGREPVTKRDVFYKNPKLFRRQAVVDRIVDDLAATFGVERGALGIVAGAKGMAYGDFTIGGRSFMVNGGGVVVPGETNGVVLGEQVQWVLVVEKEAVFRTLACGDGREGIVVTGKGYPDIATREVVRRLSEVRTRSGTLLPVYVLVDMDPHGVEIMATYKFGSMALAHENHRLAVKRIEWLGVKIGDFVEIVKAVDGGNGEVEGVMALTERDRRKAVKILGKEWMNTVPEWRSEIQKMLFLGVKVEIEILGNGRINAWVKERIKANMNG